MYTVRALKDIPHKHREAGDTWDVPSLLGIVRHQIKLGQVELVGDDKPKPKPKRKRAKKEETETETEE